MSRSWCNFSVEQAAARDGGSIAVVKHVDEAVGCAHPARSRAAAREGAAGKALHGQEAANS